jgi:hypothetical protein
VGRWVCWGTAAGDSSRRAGRQIGTVLAAAATATAASASRTLELVAAEVALSPAAVASAWRLQDNCLHPSLSVTLTRAFPAAVVL